MITGGSSGIGFAVAERFLQEGAEKVILVGRSYERLLSAAERLRGIATSKQVSASGGDDAAVATRSPEEDSEEIAKERERDHGSLLSRQELSPGSLVAATDNISLLVGDVSSADQWMRELEKEMENVDVLVNAAGISISNILPKTDTVDISRILSTNLEGAILTSRAMLRACVRSRLKKRGDATTEDKRSDLSLSKCIINISSLLALKGVTGTVTYAASKAGLLGLTRSVAVEAAETLRGVTVRSNAIVPGYIETPMIEDFSSDRISKLKDSIPLKRFGYPQEVADAAVFLASNEYANNCVLNLDGGLSAV
ncbi:hypothetical protein VTN96DRAFT_7944 [Rasamsonia emersonii]